VNTRSLAFCGSPAAAATYAVAVPRDARRRLALAWLGLALAALVGAGLFSLLLVLSRAPYTKELFSSVEFFRLALVVHVDLSVLVWFTGFAGVLWTLNGAPRALALGWGALGLACAGTAAMCAAPFVGTGGAVMANYIPVLERPLFLGGLILFGAGAALLVANALAGAPRVGTRPDGAAALRFGLNAAAVSAAVALFAFGWSWLAAPAALEGKAFYEIVFWGGGHVLQFTWTLLMFVAWLALAEASGVRTALSPRVAILLFGIALVSVFATPVIYLAWDVTSVQHYRLHTWLMRIGGGLAILPFMAALAAGLAAAPKAPAAGRPLRAALLWSLVLFGAGGAIGAAIRSNNVTIPAHYHGAIVGVTLAFMGLVYHLLPRLGFARPQGRLAQLQPALYGAGQLAHVLGLVWSGGYGVQRKVAGADQVLRGFEQLAAMGLMGAGGLAAVAGGVLFLYLTARALWTSSGSRS
jgi:cytochrome c oxidase subunit I